MANLEAQVGLALWSRSSKIPKLTDDGRAFLARAQRVTAEMDALRAFTAGLAGGLEPQVSICVDALFPSDALALRDTRERTDAAVRGEGELDTALPPRVEPPRRHERHRRRRRFPEVPGRYDVISLSWLVRGRTLGGTDLYDEARPRDRAPALDGAERVVLERGGKEGAHRGRAARRPRRALRGLLRGAPPADRRSRVRPTTRASHPRSRRRCRSGRPSAPSEATPARGGSEAPRSRDRVTPRAIVRGRRRPQHDRGAPRRGDGESEHAPPHDPGARPVHDPS